MHTYYYNGVLEGVITLNEVESNHAVKVMRSKVDSLVRIINGEGSVALGEIVSDHPKMCEVTITSVTENTAHCPKITVAIAPTKSNDRIEFFIEKATEIGIYQIVPLLCKNNERDKVNIDRWKKVALAATKQSNRSWLPIIQNPIKISHLLEANDLPMTKLIAYCEDLPEKSISDFAGQEDIIVLIGPEGDFSPEEVSFSEKQGFTRVNLGINRLRTETAGIVAVTKLL
jgi:16S rRNA (uracil1498-N3)-methyltransferase